MENSAKRLLEALEKNESVKQEYLAHYGEMHYKNLKRLAENRQLGLEARQIKDMSDEEYAQRREEILEMTAVETQNRSFMS